MKRRMFEAIADRSANENMPHSVARFVSRSGRSLAVLLEIQDEREDSIRVAPEALGIVPSSGLYSGTIH
jgi:hypothetical protein